MNERICRHVLLYNKRGGFPLFGFLLPPPYAFLFYIALGYQRGAGTTPKRKKTTYVKENSLFLIFPTPSLVLPNVGRLLVYLALTG
jgi:hypothetical protein